VTLRTILTYGLWAAAIALGVNAMRLATARGPIDGNASPDVLIQRPYTVYFEQVTTGARSRLLDASYLTAVRSDGSIMKRLDAFSSKAAVSSRLLVFARGPIITTNDVLEQKTILSDSADVKSRLRDPSTDCLKSLNGNPFDIGEQISGWDNVAGYKTARITRTNGNRRTVWVAPSLACAQLKLRIEHPGEGVVEQLVKSVLPGEPPAEMFEVPDRYTLVPRRTQPTLQ
jgi:hypothetical protein